MKREASLFEKQSPGFFIALIPGKTPQIGDRQDKILPGFDHLKSLASLILRESRAQSFVTFDKFAEATFQDIHVEGTVQPHCERDVVDILSGFQFVQEPEPLLCKGSGKEEHVIRCGRCRLWLSYHWARIPHIFHFKRTPSF